MVFNMRLFRFENHNERALERSSKKPWALSWSWQPEVEQAGVERLRALLSVRSEAEAPELRLSTHLRGPEECARLTHVRAAGSIEGPEGKSDS